MMKWLIQFTRLAVIIHFVQSLVTALVVTWNQGVGSEIVHDFGGFWIRLGANGVAGEADFAWYLHLAIFLNRVIYIYAIYRLIRLFGAFARKTYFARATIQHLFIYTGLIAVFTITRVGIEFVHYLTTPGRTGSFDGSELGNLANALLLAIITHILNEARKNAEELDDYF